MALLTRRFDEAVAYAHAIHAEQTRKVSGAPYIGHLLGVSSIVIDDGGTEDEAIAALLHDAAEDQGGRGRLDDIRSKFGEAVAKIVEDCTDSWTTPKKPWAERKKQYVEHARSLRTRSDRPWDRTGNGLLGRPALEHLQVPEHALTVLDFAAVQAAGIGPVQPRRMRFETTLWLCE